MILAPHINIQTYLLTYLLTWYRVVVCMCSDDIAAMPGVVSRPLAIQSYSQKTVPQRVQIVAPPTANYAHRPTSKLTSNTPSCHSPMSIMAPPTYRAVTSFKADCDTGNDITAPGNRSDGVAGSRASTLNRFAEVGGSSERPLTATMPTRHVVAVRLLERTNNGGDLTRR